MKKIDVCVNSEVGELEAVILHRPGIEVELMTPTNAKDALYSDILNLNTMTSQYNQLAGVLGKVADALYVKNLLADTLSNKEAKEYLVSSICRYEISTHYYETLMGFNAKELSTLIIEGYIKGDSSRDLDFILKPLYNLFFTRDASISIGNDVLIANMASTVRWRESLVMETIFKFNEQVKTSTIDIHQELGIIKIEGGDILVVRDDILLIGCGLRTSMKGIETLISKLKKRNKKQHILVQQLPLAPESFIHLDMVFTMLDVNKCMVYKPLILDNSGFKVTHIEVDGEHIKYTDESNLVDSLQRISGYELEVTCCGGDKNYVYMEREQWHSGANFFALGQGKIIGYGQNIHTIDALNKNGFEVITAVDVIDGKKDLGNFSKYVVTIDGSETSRGGGGCRCMTMPIRRQKTSD